MQRRPLTPSFFVYPTQYRAPPPSVLYFDEEEMGFEGSGFQGWATNTGGAGTCTQVVSPVKYGSYAARTRAPALADWAYLAKSSALAVLGILVFEFYVYIADFFGTTGSDYQFAGVYNDLVGRYVLALFMSPLATSWTHEGVSVYSGPSLSKSVWHRLLMEHNYSTKLGRLWIDESLVKEDTSVQNDACRIIYLGDGSGSTMRGDFYWDHVGLGRKI